MINSLAAGFFESQQRAAQSGDALNRELEFLRSELAAAKATAATHAQRLEEIKAFFQAARAASIDVAGVKSAGGPCVTGTDGRFVSGLPIPTGTVIFSFNPGTPEGWLECDGSRVMAANYRELYAVIFGLFGLAGYGDFVLPSAADLGGAPHAEGRWLIRT